MVVIGVDPHKSSHTASALDAHTHQPGDRLRIEASFAEYRRLLSWRKQFTERRWAVENAARLGRHLAQWVTARGEIVVDVHSTATARVRELSRGGRRKTDVLDAAAAASVAALHGDASPVTADGASTVAKMLDERRTNLTQQRTRSINQLHALLRELLTGGAPTDLTADRRAASMLAGIRPCSAAERARKQTARDLVADVRRPDTQLQANKTRMTEVVAESDTSLTAIDGAGPVARPDC